MAERRIVRLFAEDVGHEGFLRALVERLCGQARIRVDVRTMSARGGHGRVMQELHTFQQVLAKQPGQSVDLLVAAIDANCKGWNGHTVTLGGAEFAREPDGVLATASSNAYRLR